MANFTINVTEAENQPPVVGDGLRNTEYGVAITLTRADFTTNTTPPYFDPEGDLPLTLRIDSLPAGGILKLNEVAVVVNQQIDFITQIDAGMLTYTPDLLMQDAHSVVFNFAIADAGSGIFTS